MDATTSLKDALRECMVTRGQPKEGSDSIHLNVRKGDFATMDAILRGQDMAARESKERDGHFRLKSADTDIFLFILGVKLEHLPPYTESNKKTERVNAMADQLWRAHLGTIFTAMERSFTGSTLAAHHQAGSMEIRLTGKREEDGGKIVQLLTGRTVEQIGLDGVALAVLQDESQPVVTLDLNRVHPLCMKDLLGRIAKKEDLSAAKPAGKAADVDGSPLGLTQRLLDGFSGN